MRAQTRTTKVAGRLVSHGSHLAVGVGPVRSEVFVGGLRRRVRIDAAPAGAPTWREAPVALAARAVPVARWPVMAARVGSVGQTILSPAKGATAAFGGNAIGLFGAGGAGGTDGIANNGTGPGGAGGSGEGGASGIFSGGPGGAGGNGGIVLGAAGTNGPPGPSL